jgi:hypothetical protein
VQLLPSRNYRNRNRKDLAEGSSKGTKDELGTVTDVRSAAERVLSKGTHAVLRVTAEAAIPGYSLLT